MDRLSLRAKLWAPLIVCGCALFLLSVFNAWQARTKAFEARRATLADVIEMGHGLIAAIDADVAAGTLSLPAAKAMAAARVGALKYAHGTGYITVVQSDSVVVNNPASPKFNGKDMSDFKDGKGKLLYKEIAATGGSATGAGYIDYWWPRPGATQPSAKLSFVRRYTPWGWDLVAGDYIDDIEATFHDTLLTSSAALVVLAGLVTVIASAASRSVLRSVGGEPRIAATIAQRIAAGDLSRSTEADARATPGSVLDAIERMRQQLETLVQKIHMSTGRITGSVHEIASGSRDLSSRTESQAGSLQQTASSMEELTATVLHNAGNARQAHDLTTSASAVAEQGGRVVSQVVETMGQIAASSRKIAEIIGTVDAIAFQTNILALNAAVEAARAGEQGRGFAVVASEVRNLAQRSATAAKDIKTLIQDSVSKVAAGNTLVDEAGDTMRKVVENVRTISQIVAEIAQAGAEQSQGIQQVNQAVGNMDSATQQNAALAEQATASTDMLAAEVDTLLETVKIFKLTASPDRAARAGSSMA